MITAPTTQEAIYDVVNEFIDEGRMFTAFEVSLAVKEQGVRQRHRQMRDTVHEVIFEIGGVAGYSRTLRDVGAAEPAWVYHLPDDNPYTYRPLPRHGDLDTDVDIPLVVPVGVRDPQRLHTAVSRPSSVPRGAYGTDQRGRLCIPVVLLAQIGVSPGEMVHVTCNPTAGKVYVTRPNPYEPHDPDTTYTVEPDGNVRLTQATMEKAGIDRLPCYRIEGNTVLVTVSRFAWK